MSHESATEESTQLGDIAIGSIDPQLRVDSGEILDDKVNELTQRLDEFYEQIDAEAIPKWCVDGRGTDGEHPLAPNAAGGTYSLVVADALIDAEALLANNEKKTSADHAQRLFSALTNNGYDIGGHTDDHAEGENCGCGACDKMAQIFDFIANNIEVVSGFAAKLGVEINDDLKYKISQNARLLLANEYVSSGKKMIGVIEDKAGNDHVQKLTGSHNEVVLAVNTKSGTTLDRPALAKEFGDDYQAFNLDVWALKSGVEAIATNPEEEFPEKFAAAVVYNIATACVLAGPSLRVRVV